MNRVPDIFIKPTHHEALPQGMAVIRNQKPQIHEIHSGAKSRPVLPNSYEKVCPQICRVYPQEGASHKVEGNKMEPPSPDTYTTWQQNTKAIALMASQRESLNILTPYGAKCEV
eukprot:GHVN01015186.1.p1 GENE.GHVN01015186.1~~GHVN01015186.1.p1  ORF type:complete len:114 (-),score=7.55 GHVN01015186.1:349-690(-)